LYFFRWNAAVQLGTFTNSDAINVYSIAVGTYHNAVSILGQTCVFKGVRRYMERQGIKYFSGWWETPTGPNSSWEIMSKALWDAGMLFGTKNVKFAWADILPEQNIPRNWCARYGHHGMVGANEWQYRALADILNDLDTVAGSNLLVQTQIEAGWDINWFNAIAAKCDALGIKFMSYVDFIRNVRFNDY
jgi:hypothetical protein